MFIKALKEMETELLPTSLLAISDVASSAILELVYRCISSGVPWHPRLARIFAERVLPLLYGSDTTLENYKSVQRKMGRSATKLKAGQQKYNLRSSQVTD
jgi:hypothetical protein